MKFTPQQENDVTRFLEDVRGRFHSRACKFFTKFYFIIHHVFASQTILINTVVTLITFLLIFTDEKKGAEHLSDDYLLNWPVTLSWIATDLIWYLIDGLWASESEAKILRGCSSIFRISGLNKIIRLPKNIYFLL